MCSTNAGDNSPHDHSTGPSAFVANWNQPRPLAWKLQRTFINIGIKVIRRQRCCGHGGEPGC